MRNKILRNLTITTAVALFLLTALIIVSFVVISQNYTKESVDKSAQTTIEQVEHLDNLNDLDRFLFYKRGTSITCTIINSSGTVYGDTEGLQSLSTLDLSQDQFVSTLLKGNVGDSIVSSIDSPYKEKSGRMYGYFVKVKVSKDVDPDEFLILRFASSTLISGYPFLILMIALTGFWVFMVVFLYVFISTNVKSSLAPLKQVENIMLDIRAGRFKDLEVNRNYLPSSADKMVEEISEIGGIINAGLKNLALEKDKLYTLLSSIKQGVIVFDAKTNIVESNDIASELVGFNITCKEDFKNNAETAEVYPLIANAFDTRTNFIGTFQANARWIRVESTFPESLKFYKELYMVLLFTDVTEERRTDKIKSDFFANASHELKTPLTAISGYSELLSMDTTTDKQKKKCAEEIYNNATKMKTLLDNMLEISKMDAAKEGQIVMQDEEIGDIASDLVYSLKIIADKAKVQLSSEGTATLKCNYSLFSSMLKNLITNGIKYNHEGGYVKIIIEDKDRSVVVHVKDDGMGIPKDKLPNIFDRFYKTDESHTSTVESSTGLGLSLVKHAVQVQGGKIKVNSTVGKGTEFIITFKKEVKDVSD